jgi:hypothetical protein
MKVMPIKVAGPTIRNMRLATRPDMASPMTAVK